MYAHEVFNHNPNGGLLGVFTSTVMYLEALTQEATPPPLLQRCIFFLH